MKLAHDRCTVLESLVFLNHVFRDLDVFHHPLGRLGELRTRLNPELGEHVPLGVVRDRLLVQQPLREVLAIIALKGVLLGEVAEDGDRFVEHLVDFGFALLLEVSRYPSAPDCSHDRDGVRTYALKVLAEILVDEERNELGRLAVLVHENREGLRVGFDATTSATGLI